MARPEALAQALSDPTPKSKEAPLRPVITLPRDADGLFIQPDELTPHVALMIEHNRDRMANKWEYADEHGTGNGRTVDPKGKYNCGACNQNRDGICLAVYDDSGNPEPGEEPPLYVNLKKGSCGKYENICAGDPELVAARLPASVANYGVRDSDSDEEVFGCDPSCPFAKKTKWFDSRKRPNWCGKGASTVTVISCCTINGAPEVDDTKKSEPKETEEAY